MEGDDDVQELTDIETGNDDDIASNNNDGDADGTAAFVPTNCTSFELGHAYSAVTAMEPVYTRVPLHAVIGHTQPEWLVKQSVVSAAEIAALLHTNDTASMGVEIQQANPVVIQRGAGFVCIAGNHRSIALANMGILDETVTTWLSPAQEDTAELQDTNSDLADLPALVTDDDEDVNTAQVKSKRININNRDEVRANQRSGKDSNITQEPTIRKIDGNR
jgi:hypothetical protein